MNLLTIEHLTKSYTERLLFDDTAFSINEGEKVGVIGINGTGKSTLLKIAAGLEEPDQGSVVKGRNLYIRYLPQNPVFEPGYTVLESVIRENEGHEQAWDLEGQAKNMLMNWVTEILSENLGCGKRDVRCHLLDRWEGPHLMIDGKPKDFSKKVKQDALHVQHSDAQRQA